MLNKILNILLLISLFFVFNCQGGVLEHTNINDPESQDYIEGRKADKAAVAGDKDALDFNDFTFIAGDNDASVTQDFIVPLEGNNGSEISWSSDNSIITFTGSSALVTQPTEGGNVTVTLTATITKGEESTTKTFTVNVIMNDITPPSQVTGLIAVAAGESQIHLSWNVSSDDAADTAKIIYEICQSLLAGGCDSFATSKTTTAGVTSADITSLNSLTAYYFRVRAVDTAGNIGMPSDEATAITNAAGTVNSPTFDVTTGTYGIDQSVVISTTTSASVTICYTTDGFTLPACDAMSSCSVGSLYSSAVSIVAPSGSTTATTLKAIACKAGYIDSSISSINYTIDKTPPTQVTNLTAETMGDNQINLSWNESSDDKTVPASLIYEICQSDTSGGCNTFTESQTTSAGELTASITGLTPMTAYYFKVRAKDSVQNAGIASSEATATTNAIGIVNDPIFSVVAGDYGTDQNVAITTITSAPVKICYTTDGFTMPACDETPICIAGVTYSASPVSITASTGSTTTTIINAIACKAGYIDSSVSSINYTIDKTPPAQVTNLTAETMGDNQINLSWNISSDDKTAPESLVYEICQSDTSGGCNAFIVSQTTLAGELTANITGLTPMTAYYFKVRAKDSTANTGIASNEATATTNSTGTASMPEFNIAAGVYGTDQNVVVTTTTSAPVIICYTTDGFTMPACDGMPSCTVGNLYSSPVNIIAAADSTTAVTLNTIACKAGYIDSSISSIDYIIDKTPPSPVTSLTATTAGENQINLLWSASFDDKTAFENLVYEICQSYISGGCEPFAVSQTTAAGVTSADITGLNTNTSYYFKVRAKDNVENIGMPSIEATATTNAVGTVNAPTFSVSSGIYAADQAIDISTTTAVPDAICYTTDGFTLPACDAIPSCTAGSAYSSAVSISASAGSTTTTTLKAIACKAGYADSSISSAVYTIDKWPPEQVTGLVATATGYSQINLLWDISSDDVTASENLGYEICQSDTPGGCDTFTISKTTAAGNNSTDITGLNAQTTYYFKVRTKDYAGNISIPSDEASAVTFGTVAAPVFTPAAETFNTDQSIIISTTTGAPVTICFTTDGAVPACDTMPSCTSGSLYSAPVSITAAPGSTVTTTLKAIACKAGYMNSTISNAIYTIDKAAPAEVSGLYAHAGDAEITLSWSDPADNDFDHVEITWSPGAGYQTIPADTQTYTAGSLTNETLYIFTIKTVDILGNISTGITTNVQPHFDGIAGNKKIHSLNGARFAEVYVPSEVFKTGTNDNGTASVSHNYWIAETEVTYELWYEVYTWAAANGYTFANAGREGHDGVDGAVPTTNDQEPVTQINWRDAMVFSNALTEYYNQKNGTSFEPVYYTDGTYTTPNRNSSDAVCGAVVNTTAGACDNPYIKADTDGNTDMTNNISNGFRLPTSNEWELAARYFDDTNSDGDILDLGEYYPGNYASGATAAYTDTTATDNVAWHSGNSGGAAHNTAEKTANALGLYDMSGNVWEWVFSWQNIGNYRYRRGGDFGNSTFYTQISVPMSDFPYTEVANIGFRFTRTEPPKAADRVAHNAGAVAFNMRYIEGKKFFTGINDSGTVTLSNAYLMAETEVTYELWYAVRTWAVANGYIFANAGKEGNDGMAGGAPTAAKLEPVTTINWRDAMVFANALTEYYNTQNGTSYAVAYTSDAAYTVPMRSSADGAYGASTNMTAGSFDNPYVNPNAKGFRLPTSNEWELAARYIDDSNSDNDIMATGEYYPGSHISGDTSAPYNASTILGNYSWYMVNSGSVSHDTATKTANALGLYDICGNVSEWIFDWYTIGSFRGSRGGSYFNPADVLRVGNLGGNGPYLENNDLGFRLVKNP
ncbi:MAG: SUMF1/EgtB/PvdO family nonheme iron enzyme [Spirochaetia bacterium]|nr:SUMF1/EgtB/PvdO family nonheme iron enzyme [Spirochaetia bacterium]